MIDFAKHLRKKRVTADFETRSKSPLKKEGAYKYSLDPTTQPTCLAFKVRGNPTVYLLPFHVVNRHWRDQDPDLKAMWMGFIDRGFEFAAHNAFFERCIYDNVMVKRLGWPKIDPRRWRCTAAKAAACALPRSLEKVGEALKLRVQKDRRGYVAMMATCKPTKAWNDWQKMYAAIQERRGYGKKLTPKQDKWLSSRAPEPPLFLEPDVAPEVFRVLYTYCKIDVRSEEVLDETLPDLIPSEQEIWHLNQTLNWRGLRIDIPTVRKIVSIMDGESRKKLKELDALTMGLVTKPGAVKAILEFLAIEGVELPNLQKKTVEDQLEGFDLSTDMHRLLEIRKALSMTSTKKYHGFLTRAGSDERVRDILLYHGGSTGRDSGAGIQPQNFPRGLIKVDKNRPYAAIENVINCDPEMLRVLYGDSLGVLFSAVLRNMIVPSEGFELFVADFSKVEVAVCWWLADNDPGLKILRAGLDPYKYQAAANTGLTYQQIADEGDDRQLGKAQTLGAQFGMGWEKFRKTGWDQYRLKLSEKQSRFAIDSYRRTNPAVPALWKAYESAAIAAVENAGKTFRAGKCKFFTKDSFLWIELPSGRRLAYRDPQIAWRESEYGPRKTLEFWGVNSKTKHWALERTWGGVLTNNIVQGTARDLMMPAILRLEKTGYRALLTVHDEGISEKPIGEGSVEEFVRILCEPPGWAQGLPIEAKGWKGPRYRK